MPEEIKHDPVMEQLFYQAVAEQIELEIKLIKEQQDGRFKPTIKS
jgi:hypothetical protein